MLHASISPSVQTIAIIGSGFSGAMVATQLLQQATQPLQIKLIDRQPHWGQGLAYSTASDCHLLNVPVGKISAFPDRPDHFLNWLQHQTHSTAPGSVAPTREAFVPRRQYGAYLQEVLAEAQRQAKPAVEIEYILDEVERVQPQTTGGLIYLKQGRILAADRVVLALGNFPPSDPAVADSQFYRSHRYIGNPWAKQALASIDPDQPLLLIGSGLTMLDWVVALQQAGFRHSIQVLSRRGLLPQAHQPTTPYSLTAFPLNQLDQPRIRDLLNWLRHEVMLAQQQGSNWQAVIDAIRPQTQSLWRSLSPAEQRRFLRHLRPYWEVHRHRVAPAVAATVNQLIQQGQLQIQAGRIRAYRERPHAVEVVVQQRYQTVLKSPPLVLQVGTVINCTGSECNYRNFHHPLIQQLLQDGLVTPDALKLGLEVATNGGIIQAGQISNWLFTLGAARKGSLWETNAVPELRQQAATLAQTLLQFPYHPSVSAPGQTSRASSFKYSIAL